MPSTAASRAAARSHDNLRRMQRGGWTPLELAPFAFFRADMGASINVPNGNTFAAWGDQAPLGGAQDLVEGTLAKQPPYIASSAAFGGRPILSTGATSKGVQAATASDWRFLHNGTGCTVAWVGRARTEVSFAISTHSGAGVTGVGFSLTPWSNASLQAAVGNGGAQIIMAQTANNTFLASVGHVVVVTYRSGVDPDCVVRIDRVQRATASETGVPAAGDPNGPLSIGYATNKIGGCDLDDAETVVWNRVLSAAEIAQYEAYVLEQYRI